MEPSTVAALGKNVIDWLRGVPKSSDERKRQCIAAIERVIVAARRTQRYCTEKSAGRKNANTEAKLATLWTTIGLDLRRLGVPTLAKRCDLKGCYWSGENPLGDDFW